MRRIRVRIRGGTFDEGSYCDAQRERGEEREERKNWPWVLNAAAAPWPPHSSATESRAAESNSL